MGDSVGALVAVSAGGAIGIFVGIAVKDGGSEVGVKVGNNVFATPILVISVALPSICIP